jgi:hypothetical protein
MPVKAVSTSKLTRQTLPTFMNEHVGWGVRVTRYLYRDVDLKKMRADAQFTPNNGAFYEVGGYRLREIGAFGSIDSGVLERIVEVTTPDEGAWFPDLLGELCEDNTGPLGDRASLELREKFDRARFDFEEYAMIGEMPRLSGSKKRRDQIRVINYLARRVAGTDKELSKRFAQMLADNLENLEPSETL